MLRGVPHFPPNTPFKTRCKFYLMTSTRGQILEVIMAIEAVLSCSVFVTETYTGDTELWMFLSELIFSTGFTFHYALSLYVADNKVSHMCSLQAVVDKLTVPPVFIVFALGDYRFSGGVGFLRFSRIMKFTRVLRLLRLLRSINIAISATEDAIKNQFVSFVAVCLSLVICTTGLVQFVGNEVEARQDFAEHFHSAPL